MEKASLSFDQAPPFSAPLRFFLTAPLFALLAGLLLLWEGPELLLSRWTPGALAATHLLTIGFMLQTMLGALIQIMPVVAGVNIENPIVFARWVHIGLTLGALTLVSGFYFSLPTALTIAAIVLGISVSGFLVGVLRPLSRTPSTSPTIRGIKLAMLGLAGVVGLGMLLAFSLAHGWALPLMALTDLHASWGLGAWGGILLAAMAYVVVPMFQLTPGYQARLSWWFPLLLMICVGVWSLGVLLDVSILGRLAQAVANLLGIGFCGFTLRLQLKRRRARADVTFRYWQLGLTSAIFALIMGLTATLWPDLATSNQWPIVVGLLLIVGGFLSFITGMLYKIIPFLGWIHLQSLGEYKVPAPPMKKILDEPAMNLQMLAHGVALLVLLVAVFVPELVRVGGLFFAIASGLLVWNVFGAARRYRQHSKLILEKLGKL
ncbi:MAG: hypothetical protein PHV02_09575 [Rhodocyclaceae bacterium]|nr:hypothetical protein [Rhodocyclaceae bacterium]